jgi:hypothetical protein
MEISAVYYFAEISGPQVKSLFLPEIRNFKWLGIRRADFSRKDYVTWPMMC